MQPYAATIQSEQPSESNPVELLPERLWSTTLLFSFRSQELGFFVVDSLLSSEEVGGFWSDHLALHDELVADYHDDI